jgi:hypothetical protein
MMDPTKREWAFQDGFGRPIALRLMEAGEGDGVVTEHLLADLAFDAFVGGSHQVGEVLLEAAYAATGLSEFRDAAAGDATPTWLRDRVVSALELAVDSGALSLTLREREPTRVEANQGDEPVAPPAPPATVEETAHWIGIAVVDRAGDAVANVRFRIQTSTGTVRTGRVDLTGRARINDIPSGPSTISLLGSDASEWVPGTAPSKKGNKRVVRAGEHLAAIAAAAGFASDRTIWDHPENADLAALRDNPQLLAPGDVLFVPDVVEGSVKRPHDAVHSFTLRTTKLELRVRIRDFKGRTIPDWPALVAVEGLRGAPFAASDDVEVLPIDRATNHVEIPLTTEPLALRIGFLDPADEDLGVRARLANLGYLISDPAGDASDDEMELAVEEFQADNALPPTGVLDDATRAQLVDAFGS